MQHHRPLAKRSACDRCRDHKLRCLRPSSSSSSSSPSPSCIRCARANAECVTGAPRPLGRSSGYTLSGQPPTPQERASKRPRHSVFVSFGDQNDASKIPSSSVKDAPPAAHKESEAITTLMEQETETLTSTPSQDSPPHSLSTPFDDNLPLDTDLSNMFLFDNDASSTEPLSNTIMDLPFPPNDTSSSSSLSKLLPSPPNTLSLLFDDASPPAYPYSPHPFDITNKSFSTSSSPHILSRLAHLNDSLAHQLTYMSSFTISIPPPDLISTCVDQVSDARVNPLIRVLDSTTDLASIVKQALSQVPRALSTPFLLMTLSAHMQLLRIYDAKFLQVHKFLSGLRDHLPDFFENLPEFSHVAGLPPVKCDLYIKIVVQIIQHNISTVERAIGLPVDLCLSPHHAQSVHPRSLVGYMDSPVMVKAVMDQKSHPAEKSGRDLVTSLRTKMGDVLTILRSLE